MGAAPMSDERLAEIEAIAYYAPSAVVEKAFLDMLAEVHRLRRWQAEALAVHADWEATWEAAGRPGMLGRPKAEGVREEIARLRATLARVTDDSDRQEVRQQRITDRLHKMIEAANAIYERQAFEDRPWNDVATDMYVALAPDEGAIRAVAAGEPTEGDDR